MEKLGEQHIIILIETFNLLKNVPVIFHNLRGHDSHLIFYELHKFDVKISVIPNGLEKYMTFFLSRNLVLFDSMQFLNSSLYKLVKNLLDEDFRYLVEEFGSKNLELLKQKGGYPYECLDSFKKSNEEKLSARKYFFSSTRKGKIGNDDKISGDHVSIKDYRCVKKFGISLK